MTLPHKPFRGSLSRAVRDTAQDSFRRVLRAMRQAKSALSLQGEHIIEEDVASGRTLVVGRFEDHACDLALFCIQSFIKQGKTPYIVLREGAEGAAEVRKRIQENPLLSDARVIVRTPQEAEGSIVKKLASLSLSDKGSDAVIDFYALDSVLDYHASVSFVSGVITPEVQTSETIRILLEADAQIRAMARHYVTPKSGIFLGEAKSIIALSAKNIIASSHGLSAPDGDRSILLGRPAYGAAGALRIVMVSV